MHGYSVSESKVLDFHHSNALSVLCFRRCALVDCHRCSTKRSIARGSDAQVRTMFPPFSALTVMHTSQLLEAVLVRSSGPVPSQNKVQFVQQSMSWQWRCTSWHTDRINDEVLIASLCRSPFCNHLASLQIVYRCILYISASCNQAPYEC